jgi:hypothetical protein
VAPPTTTAPPANGQIWFAVDNTGASEATFVFSDGTLVSAPAEGTGTGPYISAAPGVHSITLNTGTTSGITCSNGRTTTSGATANFDVAPGETVGCTWTATP